MKVFISHSAREQDMVAAVAEQLRLNGHETTYPNEHTAPSGFLPQISSSLRSADMLLAVVSGANSNVFYELGLAAGAGIPILITAHSGERLPTDLTSVPFVQLTGEIMRDVYEIARRVRDFEGISTPKLGNYTTAEAALKAASQDSGMLEALAPHEFERLVFEFFTEKGFEMLPTPPNRDFGVDVVIQSPEDGQVIFVQVKKLSKQSRVSVEAVRQLLGTVATRSGATKGLLVSTSSFTEAARALGAAGPVALKTLEEFLAAKSRHDLVNPKKPISQQGDRHP